MQLSANVKLPQRLDQIVEGTEQDHQAKAYPGKLVGGLADYAPGSGTYVYLNQIYASKKGTVQVQASKLAD